MPAPHWRTRWIPGLLLTVAAAAAGPVGAPAQALAVTGPETTAAQPAVVRLTVGDADGSRACSGVLADPSWVVTAASCFADKPGSPVPAGRPALKATATSGTGQSVEIAELVPRTDRDLVLARLATPVTGIAAARRATALPAAGSEVTAVGFGRTRTEWVTDKPHTGAFGLEGTTATTVAIAGKAGASICKGDTGGPLLNSSGELIGVNSRSWQGGCLGSPAAETRTGAVSTRTDDLNDWIREKTRPNVPHDLNGDGRSDAVMAYYHGDGQIGFYTSVANPDGGFGDFTVGYTVPARSWDRGSMKLVSGDFNGDRRADLGMMYRFGDGSIRMFTGLSDAAGHIQPFTASAGVPASAGWDWNAIDLRSGDFNGDGRSDVVMAYYHGDGQIGFYTSVANPDGGFGDFTVGYT
ncbi:trypsin-like serine protease, partial [Streptomyces sp. NPDC004126]|uniref:trypsin-like serine protease n=1 Tax=Streptomyces sp. NPDC004126 TaxID=3390695 RepID=UPI003D06E324